MDCGRKRWKDRIRARDARGKKTTQQQTKGRQLNTFSQSGDLLLSAAATLCRPSVGTSLASKNPTLHHLRFHLIRRPCARTYLSAPDVGTIYILYPGPSPPTRHLGLSPRHAPRHCLAARNVLTWGRPTPVIVSRHTSVI